MWVNFLQCPMQRRSHAVLASFAMQSLDIQVTDVHCELCLRFVIERRGIQVHKERIAEFTAFCDKTNPSLYLAAKALCLCLSQAVNLLHTSQAGDVQSALKAAWTPVWHAWRPVWWECVPPPPDINNPDGFKSELKSFSSVKKVQQGCCLTGN